MKITNNKQLYEYILPKGKSMRIINNGITIKSYEENMKIPNHLLGQLEKQLALGQIIEIEEEL